jgi:hypothetical protein
MTNDALQEPEPITRNELTDRKLHFNGVYLSEYKQTNYGHVSRNKSGTVKFRAENIHRGPKRKHLKPGDIIFVSGPDPISEPDDGSQPKKYGLVDTAKDITEADLAKYICKGYWSVFEVEKGLLCGALDQRMDGIYQIKQTFLEIIDQDGASSYEDLSHGDGSGVFDIPDDTVIAVMDRGYRGEANMIAWGVTCFDSEDSFPIKQPKKYTKTTMDLEIIT